MLKKKEKEIYTENETREIFLDYARNMVTYWSKQPGSKKECISGAIFSILNMLDGGCGDIPGFRVLPICSEENKKYYIENGEKYFDEDVDIAGCLHEHFYEKISK